MPLGDFLAGAAFFLPMLVAAAAFALLVLRKRYDHLIGVERFVAFAVLFLAAVIFAHVVPATLGILYRGTPVVAALLFLVAAIRLQARPVVASAAPLPVPRSAPASIALAIVALGAALVVELARLRLVATSPLEFIDTLGFHLPGVARWIHSGTIWQVDQFEAGFATAQYPNNGDFLNVAVVLPWRDLAFVRITQGLVYGLTGVGTYALGRQLRAAPATAAIFAAVVVTIPAISNLGFEGLPDNVTLSMTAIGLAFLVRYERSRLERDLVLGGLALGIAFGAKWYGVTTIAVIIAVWAVVWLALARRPLRATALDTARLIGLVALGGGIWLVRNLIESGDPLYPKAIRLFGTTLFKGSHHDLVDTFGYSISNYLGKPSVLRKYIWPGFKLEVGIAGIVIVLGLLIVTIGATRVLLKQRSAQGAPSPIAGPLDSGSLERSDHVMGITLVAVTVGIFVLYSITPGTAYGPKNFPVAGYQSIRWLMPAAVVGCAVGAAAVRYLGPAGILFELAALVGLGDSLHLDHTVAAKYDVEAGVALLALAALVLLWKRHSRLRRLVPRRAPAAAPAALLAVLVAFVGVLRLQQVHFDRHDYSHNDPVYAYIDRHARSGHRIGITGSAKLDIVVPVLPAMGPRLGNYVGFVGDNVVHTLAQPTIEQNFDRDLRAGHYDLLLIGLRNTYNTDVWAKALGYRLIVTSNRLALYAAPAAAHV